MNSEEQNFETLTPLFDEPTYTISSLDLDDIDGLTPVDFSIVSDLPSLSAPVIQTSVPDVSMDPPDIMALLQENQTIMDSYRPEYSPTKIPSYTIPQYNINKSTSYDIAHNETNPLEYTHPVYHINSAPEIQRPVNSKYVEQLLSRASLSTVELPTLKPMYGHYYPETTQPEYAINSPNLPSVEYSDAEIPTLDIQALENQAPSMVIPDYGQSEPELNLPNYNHSYPDTTTVNYGQDELSLLEPQYKNLDNILPEPSYSDAEPQIMVPEYQNTGTQTVETNSIQTKPALFLNREKSLTEIPTQERTINQTLPESVEPQYSSPQLETIPNDVATETPTIISKEERRLSIYNQLPDISYDADVVTLSLKKVEQTATPNFETRSLPTLETNTPQFSVYNTQLPDISESNLQSIAANNQENIEKSIYEQQQINSMTSAYSRTATGNIERYVFDAEEIQSGIDDNVKIMGVNDDFSNPSDVYDLMEGISNFGE